MLMTIAVDSDSASPQREVPPPLHAARASKVDAADVAAERRFLLPQRAHLAPPPTLLW
jgi:hypothetical protein